MKVPTAIATALTLLALVAPSAHANIPFDREGVSQDSSHTATTSKRVTSTSAADRASKPIPRSWVCSSLPESARYTPR